MEYSYKTQCTNCCISWRKLRQWNRNRKW